MNLVIKTFAGSTKIIVQGKDKTKVFHGFTLKQAVQMFLNN